MSTLLKMQKFHPLCSRCIGMYPLQNRWTVLRYLQCYENFSECCTHLILPETALFSPTPTFAKEPKNIASLPTTKVYSKTGNIYLDSIINFKLSEAEQLGTKLQYRVEAASDQVIDPRDLTIILGNLLDNAITAVTSVSNKTIHFLYRETKGRIIISISNSYDGTVIMKNQKIISRKKDTRIHGYGLKNIEKTVDKYNGTVKILHDDNMFTVKLLLYV